VICNLHRYLLMLHRNQCDRTQTDTLEQPRMAHTLLCLNASSCTCLCRKLRRFPPRCRRTRCGSHPGDSRCTSRRPQDPKILHTRFGPDQSGNRSPCTRRRLQYRHAVRQPGHLVVLRYKSMRAFACVRPLLLTICVSRISVCVCVCVCVYISFHICM
jgi:hypothetical protein